MRETLLLDVPHRQVVFTIPRRLRVFFKFKRRLLGDLCRRAVRALLFYSQAAAGTALDPGVIAAIQTFGDWLNFHPHLQKLTYIAEKPPPSRIFEQVGLMAAEAGAEYF